MERKLYIYSNETNEHVATVVGTSDDDHKYYNAADNAGYSSNDYGYTWTPAFGFSSGLTENGDAEIVEVEDEE